MEHDQDCEWPEIIGVDASEAQTERERIVRFLWAVFESSTHGASGLMERAIRAVETNDMGEPVRIAAPVIPEP